MTLTKPSISWIIAYGVLGLYTNTVVAQTLERRNNEAKQVFALIIMSEEVQGAELDGHRLTSDLQRLGDMNRVKVQQLKGGEINKSAIVNYWRGVSSGSDDVLVCFYAGHGVFMGDRHVFQLDSGEDLHRAEVLAAMRARPHRLIVLISDCCSVVVSPLPMSLVERSQSSVSSDFTEPPAYPVVRDLFLKHVGLVDITAASRDEASWGDQDGGIFTKKFHDLLKLESPKNMDQLQKLDKNRNGFHEWAEIFVELRERTRQGYAYFKRTQLLSPRLPQQDRQQLQVQPNQTPVMNRANTPTKPIVPNPGRPRLGLEVVNTKTTDGVLVKSVFPDTPAARAGIDANHKFKIIRINNRAIRNVADFNAAVDAASDGQLDMEYRHRDNPTLIQKISVTMEAAQ